MTFSIVACDLRDGSWGVGVASKSLAVGAVVPAAESTSGALATQARTNLSYRRSGLAALHDGLSAANTLTALLEADEGRDERQVGVVDRDGRAATWTGAKCEPVAGGLTGHCYAVQGNMLVAPEVLDAMARTWLASDASAPLARRLLAALASGDAAGGDRRGRQAAALLVARRGGGSYYGSDVVVDLRVDDASRPMDELERLLEIHFGEDPV